MAKGFESPAETARRISLFLCGDVMTGRGIDQILPHPSRPHLFEPYARSALDYVELSKRAGGAINKPVDFAYIWGDALAQLERMQPDARIVNLETSVTTSEDAWPGKSIHYRMHPDNAPCLTAAMLDCCVLANNHVLDWGRKGLAETLSTLHRVGLKTAGAGKSADEAARPALVEVPGKGRVLVYAFCMENAGVPLAWAAAKDRAGVNLLKALSPSMIDAIARQVCTDRQALDIVVLSIHWGGNWGYDISREEQHFAHQLIDTAAVDVVYGHSSHHVKGIEVYRGKPILYGCGDFLNDYEGIGGNEGFRPDLALMYFPTLDATTGKLLEFILVPTQTRHFRVNRAPSNGVGWLLETLNREGESLGTRIERRPDDTLVVRWG